MQGFFIPVYEAALIVQLAELWVLGRRRRAGASVGRTAAMARTISGRLFENIKEGFSTHIGSFPLKQEAITTCARIS
jgi:hypothetical protein